MRERNSNSRTTTKWSPPEAAGLRPVLDFEFLSRPAPPCKQWGNPPSVIISNVVKPY
jgi:hypothetical protein